MVCVPIRLIRLKVRQIRQIRQIRFFGLCRATINDFRAYSPMRRIRRIFRGYKGMYFFRGAKWLRILLKMKEMAGIVKKK